jgi:FAD/FMN-containing dehydrogenase
VKRRTFCISALTAGAASLSAGRLLAAASADVPALTSAGKQLVLGRNDVKDLAAGLRGQLMLSGDEGYEQARKVWNGAFDRRPALIARCAGAADVSRAVTFGRTHGLLLAVRGGGHSLSGQSACEGGLLIDLSQLRKIRIDQAAKRARAEPGALLGDLDRESQAVGLATPAGTVSHTGIAGLTLGGGYGRIARKFGLTCDNLTAAEVVTADGRIVRASDGENADLMWGLRGGGGNFGVVTSFEYRLHPVDPMMYGGVLMFPLAQARQVLSFWSEFAASDELYADVVLTRGPGGAPVVLFDVCYSGPVKQAESALKPLRQAGKPVVDALAPASYLDLQRSSDANNPHGRKYYIKSGFIKRLEPKVIDAMLGISEGAPMPLSVILVHQGGAIAKVKPSATAVARREHPHSLVIAASWDDPAQTARNVEWARAAWRKLEPLTDGYYVNTANADDSERGVRDTYGANYDRLVALKNKYDPGNLFRMNANIKPA